jgi:predicted Zn-dependent protease
MRNSVQDLVKRKKNELHDNVIIPNAQAEIETEHMIEKNLGESSIQRYRRLSNEAEQLLNDPAKAEDYIMKLVEEQEGDQECLLEAANFYMKRGEAFYDKAEGYLRDAYSFGMKNNQVALLYGAILVQIGRSAEASVILKELITQKYEVTKCYLLLQISADLHEKMDLS